MTPPRRVRRAQRYDIAFYMPSVGSMISPAETLPPGGAETQVLMLAGELAARGLRIAIVAFGNPDELPDQVDGVSIVTRPRHRKRNRLIRQFAETLQIWRALWRAPSRVVVARGAGAHLGVIGLYARLVGRRFVYASANIVDFDPAKILPRRRDLVLHMLGVRMSHAIVVQTEEQVPMCTAAYGRAPDAVIKSLSPLAEQRQRTPKAFLWVGRLAAYKRPLEYVELARAVPEATFWMVGVPTRHLDGDELVAEEVIARSRTVANLKLLPPRPHAELEELMWHAVASVNTADFEGMPNVLLEAWSRGVPALVLTHDPGGVIATHRLGGFADGSRERFGELAREQWRMRDDQTTVSARCRKYIAEHHSPATIARRWCDLLDLSPAGHGIHAQAREARPRCAA